MCPHDQCLFDIGCFGRAGDESAERVGLPGEKFVGFLHIMDQGMSVEDNDQGFSNEIECFVFYVLRNPDRTVFRYAERSFYDRHVGTVQFLCLGQCVGTYGSTGDLFLSLIHI